MHQSLPEHKRRRYPRCDRCRHARRGCDGYPRGLHASGPSETSRPIPCSRCIRLKTPCSFEVLSKMPAPGLPLAISSSSLHSLQLMNLAKDQGYLPDFNDGLQIVTSDDAFQNPDSDFAEVQTVPSWSVPMSERARPNPTNTSQASDIGLSGTMQDATAANVPQLFSSIHDVGFLPLAGMGLDSSILASFSSIGQAPEPSAIDPIQLTEDVSDLRFTKIESQFNIINSIEPQGVRVEDQPHANPEPEQFPSAFSMGGFLFESSLRETQERAEQPTTNLVLRQAASVQKNCGGPFEFCSLDCTSEDCPWRLGRQSQAGFANRARTTRTKSASPKRPFRNSRQSPPVSWNDITLGQSNNKTMVISLLMQVYRGAMENSMRCWSNRHSCPWEKLVSDPSPADLLGPPSENLLEMSLYNRAHMLDRAFARFRKTQLTPEQSAGATKALKLAMLAFASQWRRSPLDTPHSRNAASASSKQHIGTYDDPESAQFEDGLRISLWNQAKDALDRRLTCDSFRDIFAKLIFLLTQRPNKNGDFEAVMFKVVGDSKNVMAPEAGNVPANPPQNSSSSGGISDEMRARTYVSNALKHMIHWRERIFSGPNGGSRSAQALTITEARNFKVMFWIAVMADTTSAAMAGVPFVVDDEACGLDFSIGASQPQKRHRNDFTSMDSPLGRGLQPASHFFQSTPIFDLCKFNPRSWIRGCTLDLEEIEHRLQNAVPLKVLQWRKVGALQNAISANLGPREIEKCISGGLSVCEFWATNYGDFFNDCIPHYGQLTFKLQSWYVLLGCHWHLACLRLAQCIESVDDEGLSSSLQRALRRSSGLTLELKMNSALAIASLARVSNSDQSLPDLSCDENSQFCPLLKSSVLLTEPWTDLSIQSFITAGGVLSKWLAIWDSRGPAQMQEMSAEEVWVYTKTHRKELEELCADTARGLKVIGLLSNTARSAARELSMKLEL